FNHRDNGIIPEGMLNYLSLLGWSLSADEDVFGVKELVENFDVADVKPNPARFDQKKLEALNADHIRLLELDDFTGRLRSYLEEQKGFPASYPAEKFAFAAELVQTRIKTLSDADGLLRFLITADGDLELDAKAAKKNLKEDAVAVLDAAIEELSGIGEGEFVTATLEAALSARLIEAMELKPRKAYGALRVAISGEAISPPLFESMELLGKDSTLARLRAARALTPYQVAE
ncbi:MAG: glutamate--tRNA ligase, partial [Mycobacteriaceae bacterium]